MLNMYASVSVPAASSAPFIVTLCPFVGPRYIVRCPGCEVVSMNPYDDGDTLRKGPLWKLCERGHKFLVTLDATCAFERVAFVDGSKHPHHMEAAMKKPRVGPSRAEAAWDVDAVRERMGLVAPVDRRKPKPGPLVVPATPAATAGTVNHKKRRAPTAYDSGDEEVDLDAALQTMTEIAVETGMRESEA